ncbi:hypothetical protein [Treponema endosymbiont of Eucomonympha sp.]|uniref:hypothetical protein n=1 Tax=Treponema endosymbiont of Eucomonympha sp. TaxID=1580831 RepID=UPI000785A083|nr:hypothetical protein [Treponema endosymbiont of Eucomonympha sp.]
MKKSNCAVGALNTAVIAAAGCANNALKAPDIRAADSGALGGERGAFHQNRGVLVFLPGKAAVIRIYGSEGFPTQEEYEHQYTAEFKTAEDVKRNTERLSAYLAECGIPVTVSEHEDAYSTRSYDLFFEGSSECVPGAVEQHQRLGAACVLFQRRVGAPYISDCPVDGILHGC